MTVEPLRLTFRRQLREQALGAAHGLTVDKGWSQVRMGEVAALTGVSRPTLYKEFGDKQGLGEACLPHVTGSMIRAARTASAASTGQSGTSLSHSISVGFGPTREITRA